jgi:glycosyltransferase involved in cell wall biosynthesis
MKIALINHPNSTNLHRGIGIYTKNLSKELIKQPNLSLVSTPESADLIHFTFFDLFFPTLPATSVTPIVVTIHDVIPLIFPKFFPTGIKGKLSFYRQLLALHQVAAVITDSQASKKDIVNFLHVNKDHVHVVYLAAGIDEPPPTTKEIAEFKVKYQLPEKFIAYVGDINYNKNLPALIKAVGLLKGVHLVIHTKANIFESSSEKQTHMAKSSILEALNTVDKSRIHFINCANTTDLANLYAGSDWYIQPSLYEGFGLPILEAFTYKTPVLAARAGSIPEVAGEAAIYFDPIKSDLIALAIKKALNLSSADKEKYVKLGLIQNAKFSWTKTAKETAAIYKRVLNHE